MYLVDDATGAESNSTPDKILHLKQNNNISNAL